jgi:hypothetical protein
MKKIAVFLILISCADKHHDFKEGSYLEEMWDKGELDELFEPKLLTGHLHNDTLFFSQTTYIRENTYDVFKCNRDTNYYSRNIIKIPTNQKYDSAVSHWTTVRCTYDGLQKTVEEHRTYFEVNKEYIDIISCPPNEKDCNPIDAWVQRLYFPQTNN